MMSQDLLVQMAYCFDIYVLEVKWIKPNFSPLK